ncbi:hypothetical protein [[Phormidium ambiguum] IAM M-71]|uniref:hypothetical protein n=1 Tax=[Phormidium ambiguum] IAM M-71 TaxID=454136 RepID=UPI0011614107|nr:hypothetical protein [Phormidium ambiguum]
MLPKNLIASNSDRQNFVLCNTFCRWRIFTYLSVMAIAILGTASQPTAAEPELPPAIFPEQQMPFVEVPPLQRSNSVNNSVIEFGQPLPKVRPRSNNSQMPLQKLPNSLNSLEVNGLPSSATTTNENANPDRPVSQVERRRRRRVRGNSKKRRQSVRRSRRFQGSSVQRRKSLKVRIHQFLPGVDRQRQGFD